MIDGRSIINPTNYVVRVKNSWKSLEFHYRLEVRERSSGTLTFVQRDVYNAQLDTKRATLRCHHHSSNHRAEVGTCVCTCFGLNFGCHVRFKKMWDFGVSYVSWVHTFHLSRHWQNHPANSSSNCSVARVWILAYILLVIQNCFFLICTYWNGFIAVFSVSALHYCNRFLHSREQSMVRTYVLLPQYSTDYLQKTS